MFDIDYFQVIIGPSTVDVNPHFQVFPSDQFQNFPGRSFEDLNDNFPFLSDLSAENLNPQYEDSLDTRDKTLDP